MKIAIDEMIVHRRVTASLAFPIRSYAIHTKSDNVVLEKVGRVGILRLNDPKRLNPMTVSMGIGIKGTVDTVIC